MSISAEICRSRSLLPRASPDFHDEAEVPAPLDRALAGAPFIFFADGAFIALEIGACGRGAPTGVVEARGLAEETEGARPARGGRDAFNLCKLLIGNFVLFDKVGKTRE